MPPIINSLIQSDSDDSNVEMTNETTENTVMVLEVLPLGVTLNSAALKINLLPNDTWKGVLRPGFYAFGIAFVCADQATTIKLTFAGSGTPTTEPNPLPTFGANAGEHRSYSFLVIVN